VTVTLKPPSGQVVPVFSHVMVTLPGDTAGIDATAQQHKVSAGAWSSQVFAPLAARLTGADRTNSSYLGLQSLQCT
jgi:hypothetical protein